VRFAASVPPDAEVRVRGRLEAADLKGPDVLYRTCVRIETREGPRTAVVADFLSLARASTPRDLAA
jgi:hypothetical protein